MEQSLIKEVSPLKTWNGIQWSLKDVAYGAKAIIENALKNYEKLSKDYSIVVNEKINLCVMFAEEHIALNIIKEIFDLRVYEKQEQFFICSSLNGETPISKEKAEALKKVLL